MKLINCQFGGTLINDYPTEKIITEAKEVINLLKMDLLYCRVDGFNIEGKLFINEIELIEPALYLSLDKDAPLRFAEAIRLGFEAKVFN